MDKTDSTLVLILTSGRISWNLSLDWWVQVLSMESVVLCGKKRNSVMYMVYFLCICMSPLCCLFWYSHQMCCYHKLLAGIDLLEYLHRERVVFFHYCFNLFWYHNVDSCGRRWGVRCQGYEFTLSFQWRGLFAEKNHCVIRLKILRLCKILIYHYIFALNTH